MESIHFSRGNRSVRVIRPLLQIIHSNKASETLVQAKKATWAYNKAHFSSDNLFVISTVHDITPDFKYSCSISWHWLNGCLCTIEYNQPLNSIFDSYQVLFLKRHQAVPKSSTQTKLSANFLQNKQGQRRGGRGTAPPPQCQVEQSGVLQWRVFFIYQIKC